MNLQEKQLHLLKMQVRILEMAMSNIRKVLTDVVKALNRLAAEAAETSSDSLTSTQALPNKSWPNCCPKHSRTFPTSSTCGAS